MPSRHKYHLVKVEAKEDHMLEEEEEAHIEVEEATLQAQMEEVIIKIQVKAQAKIKHKVRGMINFELTPYLNTISATKLLLCLHEWLPCILSL